jgi:hypothetical protein
MKREVSILDEISNCNKVCRVTTSCEEGINGAVAAFFIKKKTSME